MASVVYYLAIGICCIDGFSGLILNIFLLHSLWKTARAENLYRVPIYVSAIQGGLLCIVLIVFNPCHIFQDGNFIVPFFNPISVLLPRTLCDVILVITIVLATMMWTLIPAIGILQLTALSRANWSNTERLLLAFIFPIICAIAIAILSVDIVPTSTFHAELVDATRTLYYLEPSFELVVYGGSIKNVVSNNGRSLLPILIGIIMIPYSLTYGLFVTLVILIRRNLVRFGAAQNQRTIKTQRELYLMQVLQGFLPLAILSVPLGLIIIGALFQISMNFMTLILTVLVWACPSVQAIVQLRFIRQSTFKSPEATRTTTTHA